MRIAAKHYLVIFTCVLLLATSAMAQEAAKTAKRLRHRRRRWPESGKLNVFKVAVALRLNDAVVQFSWVKLTTGQSSIEERACEKSITFPQSLSKLAHRYMKFAEIPKRSARFCMAIHKLV